MQAAEASLMNRPFRLRLCAWHCLQVFDKFREGKIIGNAANSSEEAFQVKTNIYVWHWGHNNK